MKGIELNLNIKVGYLRIKAKEMQFINRTNWMPKIENQRKVKSAAKFTQKNLNRTYENAGDLQKTIGGPDDQKSQLEPVFKIIILR